MPRKPGEPGPNLELEASGLRFAKRSSREEPCSMDKQEFPKNGKPNVINHDKPTILKIFNDFDGLHK
jgi:hypothetical protein